MLKTKKRPNYSKLATKLKAGERTAKRNSHKGYKDVIIDMNKANALTDYRKFSNQIIFQARKVLKERFGNNLFDFIDQYPLFACPQTMLRYSYIHNIILSILSAPGDICEFGTWKGATAIYIAKMLDEYEPQSTRKIIVFDNFSGLPKPSDADNKFANQAVGEYKGDLDSMRFIIDSFDLWHRIELVEGDAVTSVGEYFKEKDYLLISLAYFDFDLYEPTISAWNAIKGNMSSPSIICFDEGLDQEHWVGEYKAAKEIIRDLTNMGRNYKLESNNTSRQPELTIRVK